MTEQRETILNALTAFANQRPGLDYANYGNPSSYRSEMRSITKDLHHTRALLSAVRHSMITGDELKAAFQNAYSGRLSWNGKSLDYCTGQYWPTEYRRAVCAVLASALWVYYREHCGCDTGDKIRAAAKRNLPAPIARRWFH